MKSLLAIKPDYDRFEVVCNQDKPTDSLWACFFSFKKQFSFWPQDGATSIKTRTESLLFVLISSEQLLTKLNVQNIYKKTLFPSLELL